MLPLVYRHYAPQKVFNELHYLDRQRRAAKLYFFVKESLRLFYEEHEQPTRVLTHAIHRIASP